MIFLGKEIGYMTNIIIYNIVEKNEYHLQKLVEGFDDFFQDHVQGIVINEYSEIFLKATYWQKKMQNRYRFNPEKGDFDIVMEEIVSVAEFGIEI